MGKTIKLIVLTLVLLQILPLLLSCNGLSDENGDTPTETTPMETTPEETTDATTTETPKEPKIIKLVKDGKLLFTTIKYTSKDPDLYSSLQKMQSKISEATGIAPALVEDTASYTDDHDSAAYEILVGSTSYIESRQTIGQVIYGNYKIVLVGNKIVIAAHTDADLKKAVNYICNSMLNKKDENGKLLFEIREHDNIIPRDFINLTINGAPISDFTIIYGSKDDSRDYNLDAATRLQEAIATSTGYYLNTLMDVSARDCITPHKIYIGNEFRILPNGITLDIPEEMCYRGKTVNGDLYITTGGYLSRILCIPKITAEFFGGKTAGKKVDIKDFEGSVIEVLEQPKTTGTEFRVMTYNIMAQWASWGGDYMPIVQRYEAFKAIIDGYDPDIIGIQEVSEQWSTKILNEMSNTYTFVNRKTPDGKFINLSTILYKQSKFDLVDSGLQYFSYNGPNQIRLVDWAILKDKATGKLLAFFNTHWMFKSGNDSERKAHSIEHAKIIKDVMAAHPDVKYAFSTGDYNTDLKHEYCINFLKNSGLVNSLDIAKAAGTAMNDVGGCGTPGNSRKDFVDPGNQIDNIFVTNNMKVLRHETILWNCVEHVSDHSPKYADIILGN